MRIVPTSVVAVLALFLLALPGGRRIDAAPQDVASPPFFRFGDYRATVGELADPASVDIGPDGNIYVAEADGGRIGVYASGGSPARSIGSVGYGVGQLLRPGGVAVAASGAVFVSDTGNHRVQVFGADGEVQRAWGGFGDDALQFNEPRGLDVARGMVAVADVGNNRVQVFTLNGEHRLTIGGPGVDEGRFNRPVDVAIAPSGAIFVADADNNRIQKFNAAGGFELAWGDWGPFSGLLDDPSAVVCHDDHVYVADSRNHRVQIFTEQGELVERWGAHAVVAHEGEGKLHYPVDLAIAPDGASAVVCESFEDRVQIFDANPEAPNAEARLTPITQKLAHFGERLDIDGKLLTIAEPESHRLYVFELSRDIPIVIGDFGERGARFGQMIRVAGLELDVDARVLMNTDTATRRLQRFNLDYDPDGKRAYSKRRAKFGRAYDLGAVAERDAIDVTWPIEPAAMERDASGRLYVVDPRNAMVHVFDAEMAHQFSFGGDGGTPGAFRGPSDVGISQDGETIFVVDAGNHRVQAFDRDGTHRFAFGEVGDGPGAFRRPFGIAAGRDGFVYVTDAGNHRVLKFTEDGTFVTAWGERGVEHEQFWKPRGIDLDEKGRVFVLDTGNHKAKIFSPDGEWLVTFGTGRAYTNKDAARRGRPSS